MPSAPALWLPHTSLRIRDAVQYIAEGAGLNKAAAENAFWRAHDSGNLPLYLFARSGRAELSPDITLAVPLLRRVHSLVYLRPMNPLADEFAERFGRDFHKLPLGIYRDDVGKLQRQLLQASRRKGARPPRGRRPIPGVCDAVRRAVDAGWTIADSLKSLWSRVAKDLDSEVGVDTVRRALRKLFEKTGDPRFDRPMRKKPSS
jgi:hypothetical protein